MQPDWTRIEDVRAWLGKAGQDLRRVEILLGAGSSPDPIMKALCFTASKRRRRRSKASSPGTTSSSGGFMSWTP